MVMVTSAVRMRGPAVAAKGTEMIVAIGCSPQELWSVLNKLFFSALVYLFEIFNIPGKDGIILDMVGRRGMAKRAVARGAADDQCRWHPRPLRSCRPAQK